MKNRILLICLITLTMGAMPKLAAQVWNTVGNGISSAPFVGHTIKTAHSDSNIYVACMPTPNFIYTDTEVFKWNGSFWTTAPKIPGFYFRDIEVINSEVFVIGYSGTSFKVLKLVGNTWTDISPANVTGAFFKLAKHGNDLVVTGSFTAAGGINDIMRYNGTAFVAYPTIPKLTYVWDAAEFQGDLYVSGQNSFNGAPYDSTFYRFNSTLNVWETKLNFIQGTGSTNTAKGIMTTPGRMYLYDNLSNVLAYENDTATYMTTLPHAVNEYTSLNQKLYVVGTQQPGQRNLTMIDGLNTVALLNTPDSLKATNALNGELYVIDKYATSWNGTTYNRAFRTNFGASTGYLNVTTYLDRNANNVFDTTDLKLPYVWVNVGMNSAMVTNHNGEATAILQSGQHAVNSYASTQNLGKNVIGSAQTPLNFSVSTNQTTDVFLPFSNTVQFDGGIAIYPLLGWRARHGFLEYYKVVVSNYGYDTITSPNVIINVPASTPIDSVPLGAQTSGQTIVYSIPDLPPMAEFEFWYQTRIDTATNNINDVIITTASLSVGGEKEPSDNIDTVSQTVLGAYDPNDKQASDEIIEIGTNSIDYHIRFQNTGNDTAYKVVVTDSLDLSNPITSVVINSASHPYAFHVVGNMLVWSFDNILLPDSSADLAGSQGFINFTANLNPNLGIGDTVKNNADIYFDFQNPIRTNTAKTTIVQTFRVNEFDHSWPGVVAYPNPTSSLLKIELDEPGKTTLSLYDLSGRLMMQKSSSRSALHTIQVAHLQTGVYLLNVHGEKGKQSTFKIVIE